MTKTYVYCISSLGQAFIGELLQADAPEGKKCYRAGIKTCGIDKYAKVLDIQYNSTTYQQWGYDCFNIEDGDKKYRGEATRLLKELKLNGRAA